MSTCGTTTSTSNQQQKSLSLQQRLYLKMAIGKAVSDKMKVKALLRENCRVSPDQNPESAAGPK